MAIIGKFKSERGFQRLEKDIKGMGVQAGLHGHGKFVLPVKFLQTRTNSGSSSGNRRPIACS